MIYIYDILLNFNTEFYEFYEWEKSDYFFHIKKIPIYKIEASMLDDILTKKIKINSTFLYEILNKTEVFDNKKIKTIKYACLFTDSYRVVGALFSDDFTLYKISDLLLDEASDAVDISKRNNFIPIEYTIIGTRKNHSFLTRSEIKIKKYLINEIKNSYREKNIQELEYLYFEFFNKSNQDIEQIYNELLASFQTEITKNHVKLYELIKLCHHEKNFSNLTN